MRKSILTLIILPLLLSSCKSNEATISGKLLGLSATTVYLEQSMANGQQIQDSVKLATDGAYAFALRNVPSTPTLYQLVYNNERVPLLIKGGEKVSVTSLGSIILNYTVTGSEESELLKEFNSRYIPGVQQLNECMTKFAHATSDEEKKDLAQTYNSLYKQIKRDQIGFIIEHKSNLAAVYALYQRLSGEHYLANAESDIIYYRTVADALSESYPDSPFLVTIKNDIARMEARNSLLQSIEERTYPELKAPNMYGEEVSLSSLAGNVILVDFWSAELGNSNAMNADLKELYNKYHEKGFEVYQVSVDIVKSLWVNAVQDQKLPWVSVCDFKGERSPMLGLYNVSHIPANFLIDSKGTIVGKDLYGSSLENKLAELLK